MWVCAVTSRNDRLRLPAGNTDAPKKDLEAKAIVTATIIAGLRDRLWQHDLLRHPRVNAELQALIEQLAVLISRANPRRGRHSAASEPTDRPGIQIPQSDLKPNPLTATTAAEFVEVLRRYRAWHGDPSWRNMAIQARHLVVHSTMHTAMNSDTLPKFDVMKAIVVGCGGDEDDLEAFTRVWQRIERHNARQTMANRTR